MNVLKRITKTSRWGLVITAALAAVALAAVIASGAELQTSELDGTANDVTVTQGSSTNFNISLDAVGSISNAITAANPSKASVKTNYSLNSAGTLSTGTTFSAEKKFYASGDCNPGGNCVVTWDGAPTKYSVPAAVAAAATTPVGDYSITLSETAGTTQAVNPSIPSGSGIGNAKLDDNVERTITVHVVAPTITDSDGDGVSDGTDNCPNVSNADQADADGDGVGNACDNCPNASNANQANADSDGLGDACDNCPNASNADQANADSDGLGDACDPNSYPPAVLTAAADKAGNEGAELQTSGAFSDADGNPTLSITKVSGAGTVTDNGDGTWSWSHTPADSGSGTVTVNASDGEHTDAIDTFNWSAANVAPTASLGNNGAVDEGSPATVSFSGQSDPSSVDTAAGFHYAYSCTNSSLASAAYANSGTTASTSCTYYDNGSYTVKARIIDKDDGYTEYTTTVTVDNATPTITSAAFTSPVTCGANNATLHIVFTDPGTLDTWTAKVDWNNDGDYTDTGENIGSVTSPFDASHTFTAGMHTVKVQVTDDDSGGSNEPTPPVTVDYNLTSIQQPVNDTGHGQNPSVFKYGSTIPVKVEVTDCDGSHPSNLALNVKYSKTSSATPPGDTEVVPTSQADLGNQMRFSDPLYVLQLSSKAVTNDSSSGYTLFVNIPSTGQSTQANIGFK